MGSTVNSLVQVVTMAVIYFTVGAYAAGTIGFWTAMAYLTATAVVSSALTVAPKLRNSSLQLNNFNKSYIF